MYKNSVTVSQRNSAHIPPHQHSNWEIILNTKGYGRYLTDGTKIDFSPGTILICPPHTGYEKISENGFCDICIELSKSSYLSEFRTFLYTDDGDKTIENLFLAAFNVFEKREKGYLTITNKIVDLICTILHNKEESQNHKCSDMLKNIIEENFTNPEFSVSHAFSSINYNEDYIRRRFKTDLGTNPNTYLKKMRLNHAKSLLTQSSAHGISISKVALMSGFYDARYFSRVFKKEFGKKPSDFSGI